ncbi:MAG: glycosyltransferase, partial [Clostridia bacterium]|nr:glycosyltransferase [Clostridia bacterium]
LISVIVPIYGVEKYLNKCVESIANQTHKDLEIILVDDGSKDNCPVLCDEWAKKDARVKVVHKENGGLSDARNAGYPFVTGDYISFIDSDDYIEPTFYETLLKAMEKSGAEIAECGTRYVDEEGKELKLRQSQDGEFDKITALLRLIKEDGLYQTVWNKLYKKEVVDGLLFEKGKYNEDEFWTYRVFDKATKIVSVETALYNYLQRSSSIIGVGYNIRRLDGLDALYERMEYLQRYEELSKQLHQDFVLTALWHLQSVLKYLQGDVKKQTVQKIKGMIKSTPKVKGKDLMLSGKYKFWYLLTRFSPTLCARLRNLLKIGA